MKSEDFTCNKHLYNIYAYRNNSWGKDNLKQYMSSMFIVLLLLSSFLITVSCPRSLSLDRIFYEQDLVSEGASLIISEQKSHIWPQQGYNHQHVGRSPYSTATNPGTEKWRFPCGESYESPIIDKNGIIYFAGGRYLYAVNPEGTLKWKFEAESGLGDFGSAPAIADDGTIYIGTKYGSYIQAVHPNGTEKWHYWVPEIDTSITIDDEGVIYYGHHEGVDARYPNGTFKWRFYTGDLVQSTPAVDDKGIIYFGSHDEYVYAVYPNSTLKWKFKTGDWVHGSPSIGDDGTIYIGSDDDYLYALSPENGTMKWKVQLASGMRASPSFDKEGNLYCGVEHDTIYSISPQGAVRWTFPIGQSSGVWGSTVAVSDDGTIYVGSNIEIGYLHGGEIIALNSDGTLKWRKVISDMLCRSSPVIGKDGSVYICSSSAGFGHLHAFGPQETNSPPSKPSIDGPNPAHVRRSVSYEFTSHDDENNPVAYFIEWGDGQTDGWTEEFSSGRTIALSHTWIIGGRYTIRAKARDTSGAESDWSTLEVTMPRSKPILKLFSQRIPFIYNFVSKNALRWSTTFLLQNHTQLSSNDCH